jgi:hypothetical protein
MAAAIATGVPLADATPEGILASEKRGQMALVQSTDMPRVLRMRGSLPTFEQLGFTFGADIDQVFMAATLPPGWTRRPTEHDMHSEICDAQGRVRVSVFYKAAFYDRRADAHLVRRFTIGHERDETYRTTAFTVRDGGTVIHRIAMPPDTPAPGREHYDALNAVEDEAKAWLTSQYPNCLDPMAYWDDPAPQPAPDAGAPAP